MLDETHEPTARTWVADANGHPDFPLQNLPLGRARLAGVEVVVTAIGGHALNLTALAKDASLPPEGAAALAPVAGGSLLALMALGRPASRALRHAVFSLLREDASPALRALADRHLLTRASLQMLLPCQPPTFSDFYSSIHHARRIGALVRPDAPLLPNYRYMPVAYHGRTTSIGVSGQVVRRPRGQIVQGPDKAVVYAPCARLDYEAELGFLVGEASPLGEPVPIGDAHDHLFGVAMLNDWSARDIQFWEYVPLGPFLGKSFATTLGAWVITRDALAPFWRSPPWDADPEHHLLPHLDHPQEREYGALNATVEVWLSTEHMRAQGMPPHRVSVSQSADSYWTVGQMIAHQTSNGASVDPGDLIGSGTLSGPGEDSCACLMELTAGGTTPIALPGGELRTFLQDGDEVTMVGYCAAPGRARIGLGEVTARVAAA